MSEKTELIKRWIEKGDHDFGTAQLTFHHIPNYYDTISFHCQQAVEKYLKAYLLFLEVPFIRTHNLNYLLSLISQKIEINTDLYNMSAELEDFSVEIRYPDSITELSTDDLVRSLSIAKTIREFVLTQMKIKVDYEEIQ